jgi:multidrug efflux system outer membrane protein
VLGAYADVEDSVSTLRVLGGQAEQVDAALVSSRRAAQLAERLYAAGRTSYLDQLDAERALAGIDRQAAQLRGSRAIATVALIRALGGGWDPIHPTELRP